MVGLHVVRNWQPLLPSQLPVFPQAPAPAATQVPVTRGVPLAAIFRQVPLPDDLHSWQPPVQAVEQQTPPTQNPLLQLVPSVHAPPLLWCCPHV
jgi:hypothetical protein